MLALNKVGLHVLKSALISSIIKVTGQSALSGSQISEVIACETLPPDKTISFI